ncbi:AAA family ATPase [Falsihalocynthiibacter sp. S25ZX9]|uniref:AAA family ATPase n=1 Tax=Falsihalocynthiibacter sp. S25ZX9 TaxID=3240870 RepID=UPI00350EBF32
MRISQVEIKKFRRFEELTIRNLPQTSKLIVIAGPNGCGKSSLFDAFLSSYRATTGIGSKNDPKYYDRKREGASTAAGRSVILTTHDNANIVRGSVYVRSAYRNDAEFVTRSLSRQGNVLDSSNLTRLIELDATVANNYQRLASQAMEDVFAKEDGATTISQYRDRLVGEISAPLKRIFGGLEFVGLGNPLDNGSFLFSKGNSKNFDYKNLSGGEKAAFDLVLDIVVKRTSYPDAIYCIDEPELHMNSKLQGALLEELLALIPDNSQLWIATHSIGMMRKAREIYDADTSTVAFLDFGDKNFDQIETIEPAKPNREFWTRVLEVALDDLSALVAPSEIIICEGNPTGGVPGKNSEYDAHVYGKIFGEEKPDVKFISAGNSIQIQSDFIGLATQLPNIAKGINVVRLIDLDDHSPTDVIGYKTQGINILSRRHLECYLYDDEVLSALCNSVGKPELTDDLLQAKATELQSVITRGFPEDDLKKAAGKIYTEAKRILSLRQVGNDKNAFAKQTLAPLLVPTMSTYRELRANIFGD